MIKMRDLLKESTNEGTWQGLISLIDEKSKTATDDFAALNRYIVAYVKMNSDQNDKIDRFPTQSKSNGYSHDWTEVISWADLLSNSKQLKYFNQRMRQDGQSTKSFIKLTSNKQPGTRITSDTSFS